MQDSKQPSKVVDINDPDNVFDLRPGNRLNYIKFASFVLLVLIGFGGVIALIAMVDSFAKVVAPAFQPPQEP